MAKITDARINLGHRLKFSNQNIDLKRNIIIYIITTMHRWRAGWGGSRTWRYDTDTGTVAATAYIVASTVAKATANSITATTIHKINPLRMNSGILISMGSLITLH